MPNSNDLHFDPRYGTISAWLSGCCSTGAMKADTVEHLEAAAASGRSILVVGGTGSGKPCLAVALGDRLGMNIIDEVARADVASVAIKMKNAPAVATLWDAPSLERTRIALDIMNEAWVNPILLPLARSVGHRHIDQEAALASIA